MTSFDDFQVAIADRYHIVEEIGAGGMAVVYRAIDRKHERAVALKIFRPELRESIGGERFMQEIKVTASLSHPHILPLFDSGDAGGVLFYVTSLIEGRSLKERLDAETRLPVAEVVSVIGTLADSLQFAHERGVIHRDIKPENILFQGNVPLLADFGIALALDAAREQRITQTGLLVGTPHYMSPEQASGDPELDGRSDQYALACVAYEMLVGEPPFGGTSLQAVLAKRFLEEPPPMADRRTEVPPALEAALRRGLETSPADRFPSMSEFAAALRSPTRPSVVGVAVDAEASKSTAVLPFVNMSADPENEYFVDGMTDDLISALGRIPGVRVVGRTSAFAFKGRHEDLRTIGRQLDVGTVVEGSVRKAGDQIRVNVKLVSTVNGFELWSERYDRALDDVFAVQDELVSSISAALRRKLAAPGDEPAAWTESFEAYDHYLKGRHAWNRRTESSLRESVRWLRAAIEADPGFAVAQAALADSYLTLAIYGGAAPEDVMPLARAAADEALGIAPTLPEALTARGGVRALFDWDWAAADEDFRAAIAAGPEYPTAYQSYAMNCLVPQREFAIARRHLRTASRIDPLAPVVRTSLAVVDYYAGDFERAATTLTAVTEAEPTMVLAWYFLGLARIESGEVAAALEAAAHALELAATPEVLSALGYVAGRAGEEAQAREHLETLGRLAHERYVSPILPAQVHAGLGRTDDAFVWLERAVDQRATLLPWVPIRPVFGRLRSDPRMARLAAHLHVVDPAT